MTLFPVCFQCVFAFHERVFFFLFSFLFSESFSKSFDSNSRALLPGFPFHVDLANRAPLRTGRHWTARREMDETAEECAKYEELLAEGLRYASRAAFREAMDWRRAARALCEAIALRPDEPMAYFNLGSVLSSSGHEVESAQRFLEAKARFPEGSEPWARATASAFDVLQHGQSAVLAVPQLGSCASSGRAWRLWAARHAQEAAVPLGAQPVLPPHTYLTTSHLPDHLTPTVPPYHYLATSHLTPTSHLPHHCLTTASPPCYLATLGTPVAALGSSARPGSGRATGRPTSASGARASRLQSRRFHGL